MAVQTGTGNRTTATSTAATFALSIPTNLAVGDVLVCAAHDKNGSGSTSFSAGTWIVGPQITGTRRGGFHVLPITSQSVLTALGTSINITMGAGTSRRVAELVRITGRDLSTPIDASGAEILQASASATLTLPAISATKTGSDIVAMGFCNVGSNLRYYATGTDGLTVIDNPYISDAGAASTLLVAKQDNATTAGQSTGTRSMTISPTPTLPAGGVMFALAPLQSGTASGDISWSGAAQGVRTPKSSAAGNVNWVGGAVGTEFARGSAAGSVAWGGSAAGKRVPLGAAAGAFNWSGGSVGTAPTIIATTGSGVGAVGWSGTASGRRTALGTASGSIVWAGGSAGHKTSRGTAAGGFSWGGTASGKRQAQGVSTGVVTWAGIGTGVAVAIGSGSGTVTWGGTAVGARQSSGTATGAVGWQISAVGTRPLSGSAAGAVNWAGTAAGHPAVLFQKVRQPRLTLQPNRAGITVSANRARLTLKVGT